MWQIHQGGGKGKRLSLDFLVLELMLWIRQGITVMHRVRIRCEQEFFVSALTGASWGGLEPAWIRSQRRALLYWLVSSPILSVCLALGSARTPSAGSVQPFLSFLPHSPPFFFSLYCHKCPQGVGHGICADWRDPEGNFSASR